MALKIKDLDGLIGEVIAQLEFWDGEMILVSEDDSMQILRDKGCIYIKELGVDVYGAYVYYYEPETEEWEIDSDLYIFYLHKTDTEVYSEGGSSLPVCISNYCHYSGTEKKYTMEEIDNLEIEYILNDEDEELSDNNNK